MEWTEQFCFNTINFYHVTSQGSYRFCRRQIMSTESGETTWGLSLSREIWIKKEGIWWKSRKSSLPLNLETKDSTCLPRSTTPVAKESNKKYLYQSGIRTQVVRVTSWCLILSCTRPSIQLTRYRTTCSFVTSNCNNTHCLPSVSNLNVYLTHIQLTPLHIQYTVKSRLTKSFERITLL